MVYQIVFDNIEAELEKFRCKINITKYIEPKRKPISCGMKLFNEND